MSAKKCIADGGSVAIERGRDERANDIARWNVKIVFGLSLLILSAAHGVLEPKTAESFKKAFSGFR